MLWIRLLLLLLLLLLLSGNMLHLLRVIHIFYKKWMWLMRLNNTSLLLLFLVNYLLLVVSASGSCVRYSCWVVNFELWWNLGCILRNRWLFCLWLLLLVLRLFGVIIISCCGWCKCMLLRLSAFLRLDYLFLWLLNHVSCCIRITTTTIIIILSFLFSNLFFRSRWWLILLVIIHFILSLWSWRSLLLLLGCFLYFGLFWILLNLVIIILSLLLGHTLSRHIAYKW